MSFINRLKLCFYLLFNIKSLFKEYIIKEKGEYKINLNAKEVEMMKALGWTAKEWMDNKKAGERFLNLGQENRGTSDKLIKEIDIRIERNNYKRLPNKVYKVLEEKGASLENYFEIMNVYLECFKDEIIRQNDPVYRKGLAEYLKRYM